MKNIVIALLIILLLGGLVIFWDDIIKSQKSDPLSEEKVEYNLEYKHIEKSIDALLEDSLELSEFYTILTDIQQSKSAGLINETQSQHLVKKLATYFSSELNENVENFFKSNSEDFSLLNDMHKTMKDISKNYQADLLEAPLKLTSSYYLYTQKYENFKNQKKLEFNVNLMDDDIKKFSRIGLDNPLIANYKNYKDVFGLFNDNWNKFKDIKSKYDHNMKKNKYECEDFKEYIYYYNECLRLKHENATDDIQN